MSSGSILRKSMSGKVPGSYCKHRAQVMSILKPPRATPAFKAMREKLQWVTFLNDEMATASR